MATYLTDSSPSFIWDGEWNILDDRVKFGDDLEAMIIHA